MNRFELIWCVPGVVEPESFKREKTLEQTLTIRVLHILKHNGKMEYLIQSTFCTQLWYILGVCASPFLFCVPAYVTKLVSEFGHGEEHIG